ncbi:MAG: glycosyltransferase family 2 protein [Planctomycetia bacterium]|nr:glycosyltransferase family 2 protein [Planctomycetia bacterium]
MNSISVVVPLYDEVENVPLLYESVRAALDGMGRDYELIFVDDGSRDGSGELLAQLADHDPRVKVIQFRRNFGQTAAMHAGMQAATGEIVVTLDADLQNEPADIPMMVAKLEEGYDLVHGWRKERQDALLNRKLPSRLANRIISRVTGFPVNDLGCTLKAMTREIAHELQLYGEMHRFIPILAHWHGARCVEVVTRHHPRRFGHTKYGIWRTFRVVLDLITVKYMIRYSLSPMKLFGGIGLLSIAGGLASGAATLWMKLAGAVDMTGNPLLLLSAFATMLGVQFLVLGLLGEVSARIYYECQDKKPYAVRKLWNFTDQAAQITAPRRAA